MNGIGLFSFVDGGFTQIFGQIVSIIVKRLENLSIECVFLYLRCYGTCDEHRQHLEILKYVIEEVFKIISTYYLPPPQKKRTLLDNS